MDEKYENLLDIVKPAVNYLKNNHNPYTAIVITEERVVVVEDVCAFPISEPVDMDELCQA